MKLECDITDNHMTIESLKNLTVQKDNEIKHFKHRYKNVEQKMCQLEGEKNKKIRQLREILVVVIIALFIMIIVAILSFSVI